MQFTAALREPIRRGLVRCSVRFWTRPQVTVGRAYALGDGWVVVESVSPIPHAAITPALARESGFPSRAALLRVARHGASDRAYLVRFHFTRAPELSDAPKSASPQKRKKRLTLTTRARF